MRDGVLLLVLGLVSFGGFLAWRHYGNPFATPLVSSPQTEVQPAPVSPPPHKAVTHKAQPAPTPALEAPVAAAEVIPAPEPPPAPVAEHRDPPPFPGVGEISNGVPGDAVTTRF